MTAPSARPGLDRTARAIAAANMALAFDRLAGVAPLARAHVNGEPLPAHVLDALTSAIDAVDVALPVYQSGGGGPPVWEWSRLDELKVGDRVQHGRASVTVGPWTTVDQVLTWRGRTKVWCEEQSTIFTNTNATVLVRRQVTGLEEQRQARHAATLDRDGEGRS